MAPAPGPIPAPVAPAPVPRAQTPTALSAIPSHAPTPAAPIPALTPLCLDPALAPAPTPAPIPTPTPAPAPAPASDEVSFPPFPPGQIVDCSDIVQITTYYGPQPGRVCKDDNTSQTSGVSLTALVDTPAQPVRSSMRQRKLTKKVVEEEPK
ncbi:hypothetical protein FRC10_012139 [Ceratobasidium sp. 414]|nr:hypothetical protein FRC10_012139 [Ceratobasidium sp. 414]